MTDPTSSSADRREQFARLIRSVPLFAGLSGEERLLVLERCGRLRVEAGTIICREGDASDELFILVAGKLVVRLENAPALVVLEPVSTIGEVGVFTGRPRNATVEAVEPSLLLVLRRVDVEDSIARDPGMGVVLMRNVISILADRLTEDNIRIREFQQYIISREQSSGF